MNSLQRAFWSVAGAVALCVLGFFWGAYHVGRLLEARDLAEAKALNAAHLNDLKSQELAASAASMKELQAFLKAWVPYLDGAMRERDPAVAMRADLESLAQRRLGLVTDQITTPEPLRIAYGTRQILVQRVSVRASGESLPALLAWVGEAQARYPLARVDSCELTAGSSGNASLLLSFSQPVSKPGTVLFSE